MRIHQLNLRDCPLYRNELMLGYAHHIYQFPGGTQEPNEPLIDTINREIEEETGIRLNAHNLEAFARSLGYYKDFPEVGRNRKIEIYYYEIKTDERPHLDNLHLTKAEKDGNFELRYVPLDEVETELNRNVEQYGDQKGIAGEMFRLLKVYKKNYK